MAWYDGAGAGGLGALSNIGSTALANWQNSREAKKNRTWQEKQATTAFQRDKEMATIAWNRTMQAANTSHQREVADLRAAGLNPILSAGGGGATTPSHAVTSAKAGAGAQAKMEKFDVVHAAQAAAANAQGIRNAKQQNEVLKATEMKEANQGSLAEAQRYLVDWQTTDMIAKNQVTKNTAESIRLDNMQKVARLTDIITKGQFDKTDLGNVMSKINRVLDQAKVSGGDFIDLIPTGKILELLTKGKKK